MRLGQNIFLTYFLLLISIFHQFILQILTMLNIIKLKQHFIEVYIQNFQVLVFLIILYNWFHVLINIMRSIVFSYFKIICVTLDYFIILYLAIFIYFFFINIYIFFINIYIFRLSIVDRIFKLNSIFCIIVLISI